MTNFLRAASIAAVTISAAGTFVATDPGFATDMSASAAAPLIQVDPAALDGAQAETAVEATEDRSVGPESDAHILLPQEDAAILGDESGDEAAESAIEDAIAAEEESLYQAASLSELVGKMPIPGRLDAETQCLAGTIYFESKGESLSGQLAVGRVVLNRVASSRFPNTICGVVYQRSQFSFVRGGSMPRINTSSRAWRRAIAIAQIAQEELWENEAKGALFFHATYVSPRWRLTRVTQIDKHIFYR